MSEDNITKKFLGAIQRIVPQSVQSMITPTVLAASGTYMYPLEGLKYFILHPILWAHMLSIFLPEIFLYILVYSVLYVFLYPAQTAIALIFNGPIGIFTAWVALLNETAVTVQFLSQILLLPRPLRVLFDTILSREGLDDLVVKGKLRKITEPTPLSMAKKRLKQIPKKLIWPTWTVKAGIKFILHFIPVLGPAVLVASQGPKVAQECHKRYFELKGFDAKQQKIYVNSRRGQYMGFGIVAAGLESVPVLGFVFSFTNTVGAALWAAAVEKKQQADEKLLDQKLAEDRLVNGMMPIQLQELPEELPLETELPLGHAGYASGAELHQI